MRPSVGAALLVAITLAVSSCGGGNQAGNPHASVTTSAPVAAGTTSSTGLILDGRVRCTATVPRSVQAGSSLGLEFAVRNISTEPVKVPVVDGLWFVVRAADGTTYDTRVPLREEIGPRIASATIPPGTTKTVRARDLRVRWRGPLRVTPGCDQAALPDLRVGVDSPGPPPDDSTAVADVVAASGHLLDHCRPERAGVAVQGQVGPPDGDSPPMSATCSVSLRQEGEFVVAQALIVSPPDLDHVDVGQPYEQLTVRHDPTYEAVAWEFVVTRDGATSVAASEADSTKRADRMAPDWSWTGSEWQGPGGSRCGGSGGSWGGWAGPTVEFVSVCPA
jgi:hypothetical protein